MGNMLGVSWTFYSYLRSHFKHLYIMHTLITLMPYIKSFLQPVSHDLQSKIFDVSSSTIHVDPEKTIQEIAKGLTGEIISVKVLIAITYCTS